MSPALIGYRLSLPGKEISEEAPSEFVSRPVPNVAPRQLEKSCAAGDDALAYGACSGEPCLADAFHCVSTVIPEGVGEALHTAAK